MKKFLVTILLLLSLTAHAKDVLLSFDGSADLKMWESSLVFAKANNVKFTYFISAPYFVEENTELANSYWAPKELGQPSPLSFRRTQVSYGIGLRFKYLQRAVDEGNEIGSHLVGHYDGHTWTKEQWRKEFAFFEEVFKGVNPSIKIETIRTPCLGINQNYFDVLNEMDYYKYDSSAVVSKRFPGHYNYGKIKEAAFPEIRIINKPTSGYILPMDYNFDTLHLPDEVAKRIFLDTMKNYYLTSEGPVLFCLHFEQMANGAYYQAMKEFVEWAKDKDAHYYTYKEYLSK